MNISNLSKAALAVLLISSCGLQAVNEQAQPSRFANVKNALTNNRVTKFVGNYKKTVGALTIGALTVGAAKYFGYTPSAETLANYVPSMETINGYIPSKDGVKNFFSPTKFKTAVTTGLVAVGFGSKKLYNKLTSKNTPAVEPKSEVKQSAVNPVDVVRAKLEKNEPILAEDKAQLTSTQQANVNYILGMVPGKARTIKISRLK